MFRFRRSILRLWYFPLFLLIVYILSLYNLKMSSNKCTNICPYSSKLTKTTLEFNSIYRIQHYPSFVCSQNFRNLADWIYPWTNQFNEDIEVTTNDIKRIAPCLSQGSIIYVRIWAINDFFQFIYPYLINNFILITSEGDLSSPSYLNYLEESNSKIIHWFGQIGRYDVSRFFKFTHIPIGINCYKMADIIRKIHLQQSTYTVSPVFYDMDEPEYYIQPLDVSQREPNQNLLLIILDEDNDQTQLRLEIWNDMCTLEKRKDYPFVTCIHQSKDVKIFDMSQIYEQYRQYPFWFSPYGIDLDCHRTWEAFYLDIIPIVWNTTFNILYENLPVVIINDHRQITESFLREQFKKISEKKLSEKNFYQYEKLRHAYWRDVILKQVRHRDIIEHHRRCWRAKQKFQ